MTDYSNLEDIVKPSKLVQIVVACVLLVFGVGILLLLDPFINSIMPQEKPTFEAIENTIGLLVVILNNLLILSVIISVSMSYYYLYLAFRIKKTGRYPPPNFVVIRKKKIKWGVKARNSVWFSYLFALLSWLPTLLILYLKWLMTVLVI
ncbi:MAG: hypothetical protein ABW131_05350 [Candidatus Sedimenticola sp. 6PFRAG5]